RAFTESRDDRKYLRDDHEQTAFTKLRISIGAVYAWRNADPNNHNPVVQQRIIKEADFAFRQAFAFCPYSPEAVFRYVNLLLSMQKFEEALTVASTCLKLDPYNGQVIDLVTRLQAWKKSTEAPPNQANLQAMFNQAANYLQAQQTNRAVEIFDRVLNDPRAEPQAVLFVAQRFAELNNYPRLEAALDKLVKVAPDQPDA